jgi:hypothetical protein
VGVLRAGEGRQLRRLISCYSGSTEMNYLGEIMIYGTSFLLKIAPHKISLKLPFVLYQNNIERFHFNVELRSKRFMGCYFTRILLQTNDLKCYCSFCSIFVLVTISSSSLNAFSKIRTSSIQQGECFNWRHQKSSQL